MPIYEFACDKCRRIYSFLSRRIQPERVPVCPKCRNPKLHKEISQFAMLTGVAEPAAPAQTPDGDSVGLPDADDPRMERALGEIEDAMQHLDENNPKHMAIMMKKMKDMMPPGSLPKEMDVAIRRLEKGEDPEKIEEDMGEIFGQLMGDDPAAGGAGGGGGGAYAKDPGLYSY